MHSYYLGVAILRWQASPLSGGDPTAASGLARQLNQCSENVCATERPKRQYVTLLYTWPMYVRLTVALVALAAFEYTQMQSPESRNTPVSHRASGAFEVKVAPLEPYNRDDKLLGRFSIDKQFHGGLEATSKGEMLSAGSPSGSGGYVAIEKVMGKLDGRSGSFVLQHNATMEHGKPNLNIIVVPGSGTEELSGIAGKMDIIIEGGKHSYVFDYTLPNQQ
jgi:hypothetical protein